MKTGALSAHAMRGKCLRRAVLALAVPCSLEAGCGRPAPSAGSANRGAVSPAPSAVAVPMPAPPSEPAVVTASGPAPTVESTPPVRPEPDEGADARRELAHQLEVPVGCDAETHGEDRHIETHALAGGTVVTLLCQLGAYNRQTAWFWVEGPWRKPVHIEPLRFATWEPSTPPRRVVDSLLRGADEYDPVTATVTVWRKMRGLGDCGTFATYRFDPPTPGRAVPARVTTLEVRVKTTCDGAPTAPKSWPLMRH